MTSTFRTSTAQIIGRGHVLSGVNCQDTLNSGAVDINGSMVIYGVICDGCSEGKNSEVGAKLAVEYIGRQIEILVKSNVPLAKIPPILHKRIVNFMRDLLGMISFDSPESRVNYIKDNLLFTIIAFIKDDNQFMVFVQGDGVIVVDGDVQIRDENDSPMYIGYNLVERKYLSSEASALPEGFEIQFFDANRISRFAIASDSLGHEILIIPLIWDNKNRMSLQKKVNAWSWNDHRFSDDLALIVMEKIPEGG